MTTVEPPVETRRAVRRLLPEHAVRTVDAHEAAYGPLPHTGFELIDEVGRAGLRGRGGAGFPTATKLAAVASRRRAIVLVNATEGEPASRKDEVLASVAPHLVIDGAVAAARAVGARDIHICVDRSSVRAGEAITAAVHERQSSRREDVRFAVHGAPDRYVAGEETALVHWLNGGDAKPTFVPPRPFERGINGRPTLVQNAETLAHLALVARHGAAWFRAVGTDDDPGTALVTLCGAVERPGVSEVPHGAPLAAILRHGGVAPEDVSAILVGGYFGTWLPPSVLARTTWDRSSLQAVGASPGCGVVAVMTRDRCGLAELARVARWMAAENAGQCGPCVNGLPAIAEAVAAMHHGDRRGDAERNVRRWLDMVVGRGACRHPDGFARFVRSGLDVFAADVERHRRSGPCPAAQPLLPVPATGGWR